MVPAVRRNVVQASGLGELMETLPWINIRQKRKVCWDEANRSLSLFVYRAVRSRQADEVTKFIHAFKASDPEAFKAAIVEVYDAAGESIEEWKRECNEEQKQENNYNCRYVVPVPSHSAHQISESSRRMCDFIATIFHLEYPETLLFRKETITPAHLAYPGQRPTSTEHFQSLGCGVADLGRAGII
jgi:hypothetical protein